MSFQLHLACSSRYLAPFDLSGTPLHHANVFADSFFRTNLEYTACVFVFHRGGFASTIASVKGPP